MDVTHLFVCRVVFRIGIRELGWAHSIARIMQGGVNAVCIRIHTACEMGAYP